MGRRENAVAAGTRDAEALALWLRAQRERRGVTYEAMAKLIGYQFTASMLSRGASGKIPSRKLVEAYAKACDADRAEAVRLWKAARRSEEESRLHDETVAEFQDLATSVRSALTHPEVIETFGQLRRAMIHVRAEEGQPSLGVLQAKAGRTADGRCFRLPKSSLSAVLRGGAVPSRSHVTAFMEALDASPGKVREWERAWDRIAEFHARRSPAAAKIRVAGAPAVRPPQRPVLLMTTAVDGVDFEYLRDQVVSDYAHSDATPRIGGGPRRSLPPAGHTRSGLPIRTPSRYERPSHRVKFSTRLLHIPLSPPKPSGSHQADTALLAPQTHYVVREDVPAAPPKRMARIVDRWFSRKPRRDHARWPQY
ncbi:helix-turn-helix domain-containing protein [Streptomyces mutomycini]|uniref:Helix-turn-helix domain-containing protein n=1 Tax=Streptomyces mutomycini TaxID=284036 RepID=A0ABW0BCP4_9ACTN|nr:helix-turn-helix transcriptional regulator [Streptomyces mutomycini]